MPQAQKKDVASIDGPFHAEFRELAKELDSYNEKRERLIRASRDVTMASKKIIFQLHRADAEDNEAVLERASVAIRRVLSDIAAKIAVEINEGSETCFRKFYSPGMQEFVEARELLEYMTNGNLAGITRVQEEVMEACKRCEHGRNVRLEVGDYVLGVADLTGECMRLAVQKGGKGEVGDLGNIRKFVNEIWACLSEMEGLMGSLGNDFCFKMKVMRASLEKVEKSLFEVKIRRAEFGASEEGDEKRRKLC